MWFINHRNKNFPYSTAEHLRHQLSESTDDTQSAGMRASNVSLQISVLFKSSQEASKSCPYCGKSFKGATTRRQHMVQCAMQPRTDHCQCEGACGCRSVTSSSSTLMSSPAPALPASSAATPASSSASQRPRLRSANLSGDLSACTLNPPCFTCLECKKTFVSAANLIRHRNKYHERLVLDFPKQ